MSLGGLESCECVCVLGGGREARVSVCVGGGGGEQGKRVCGEARVNVYVCRG